MIEVNDLTISTETKTLVKNVSFSLGENESLGIIGKSGSGKSLTALAIMGLLDRKVFSVKGSIKFFGQNLFELSEKDLVNVRLSKIAFVYQNPFNTFSPVEKINKQINRIYKIKKIKRDNDKIKELLKEVSLNESYLNKYPYELSGGELQRLVILTSLLFNPMLLICDEPTTSLDEETGIRIIELLNKIRVKNKLALIFITHDLSIVDKISQKLIIMNDGEIIERGKTFDILKNPKSDYTKKLLVFSKLGD